MGLTEESCRAFFKRERLNLDIKNPFRIQITPLLFHMEIMEWAFFVLFWILSLGGGKQWKSCDALFSRSSGSRKGMRNSVTRPTTKFALQLLLSLSILSTVAFGNIRNFTVSGGGLVADSASPTARMLDEYVHITMYRESCLVRCEFTIVDSVHYPSFVIGFPLVRAEMDHITKRYAGKEPFLDTTQMANTFRCYVDGHPVPTTMEKDTTSKDGPFRFTIWQLFSTELHPGIPKKIICEYKDRWFSNCQYYIGTGSSWSRGIESGTIVFDHSKVASTNFVARTSLEDPRCSHLNSGSKIVKRFNDSLVYILKNHQPEITETVNADVYRFWSESIAPSYLDTISARFFGSKRLSIGNLFVFRTRFLWDTVAYVHKGDLQAIRDELLLRTKCTCLSPQMDTADRCKYPDCYLGNCTDHNPHFRDSVSYLEKANLAFLTERLSDLREEHKRIHDLQQEILIKRVRVSPLAGRRMNRKKYADSLKIILLQIDSTIFPGALPIYKYGCNGEIRGRFTIDEWGVVREETVTGTTDPRFLALFKDAMGLQCGLGGLYWSEEPAVCEFEIKIVVSEGKKPFPFNEWNWSPCHQRNRYEY